VRAAVIDGGPNDRWKGLLLGVTQRGSTRGVDEIVTLQEATRR